MYHVEITSDGDSAFKVKSDDYEFIVDGKGKGIAPSATLLASLGACIGVYLRKYCNGGNLELKDFNIKVDAELTKEPVFCFKKINVAVNLAGVQLDERRKAALLNFIKKCPIHNTLKANPEVEITLV